MGEEGADTGGLSREFFRLVCYSISNQYLESTGCFRHDATAYQVQAQSNLTVVYLDFYYRNEYIDGLGY